MEPPPNQIQPSHRTLLYMGNRNFRRDLLSAMATPKVPLYTPCIVFDLDTSILAVALLMISQIQLYIVFYQYIVNRASDK